MLQAQLSLVSSFDKIEHGAVRVNESQESSKVSSSTISSIGETSERGNSKKRGNPPEDYPTHIQKNGNTRSQPMVAQIHTVHKNDSKHRSKHYHYRTPSIRFN